MLNKHINLGDIKMKKTMGAFVGLILLFVIIVYTSLESTLKRNGQNRWFSCVAQLIYMIGLTIFIVVTFPIGTISLLIRRVTTRRFFIINFSKLNKKFKPYSLYSHLTSLIKKPASCD
jgi:hypothetical protein